MVSSRGGKYGYVVRSRHDTYRKLRKKGMSKSVAAAISNKGRTFAGRSAMSRKGWAKPGRRVAARKRR